MSIESSSNLLWSDRCQREAVLDMLARSVSKSGSFILIDSLGFREACATVSLDETVEFYCDLRERCDRLEPEWRPAFLQTFPQSTERLPEVRPVDNQEFHQYLLFLAILGGDVDEVRGCLQSFQSAGASLDALPLLSSESLVVEVPVTVAPGATGVDTITFREAAQRLGFPLVAEVLREAGVR